MNNVKEPPKTLGSYIDQLKYLPRVLSYLRPYWWFACCSIVLIFLAALFELMLPWPLKILIDNVLGDQPLPDVLEAIFPTSFDKNLSMLIVVVASGFGLTLLQNAVAVVSNYVNTRIDQNMVLDFRSDLFQHAQRLSLAYHDHRRTGKTIFAINNMGGGISRLIMVIPPLSQSVLTLCGMFWITFKMDQQLALISLSVIPFLYYSVGHYIANVYQKLRKVKGMEAELLSMIHEAMSMIRVIVAFGREDHEYQRYRDHGERTVDARVKLTVRQTLFSLAVNTTTAAGTAVVLGVGAHHVLEGKLSIGQLLVVMSYIAAVYKPLEAISKAIGSLQEVFISLEIAFKLLDSRLDIKDSPNAVSIAKAKGFIAFENVDFSYEGRKKTLQNICFTVKAGEAIGIVGPTGAGKTTLVSLLARFYEPKQGVIYVDNQDVRNFTLKSLRSQISIVLQEPLLFSATIAENILYGRLDASMKEVQEAAKAANAHDFIMRLPKKYKTKLGERGAKLSGGERQRISIARSFLKDAPILILDEPTSSVDVKTESVILDALDRLMVGRTTFMIAHRLSTIRHADRILVLNEGELLDVGSHDELLKHDGLYKEMYELQTKKIHRSRKEEIVGIQSSP